MRQPQSLMRNLFPLRPLSKQQAVPPPFSTIVPKLSCSTGLPLSPSSFESTQELQLLEVCTEKT